MLNMNDNWDSLKVTTFDRWQEWLGDHVWLAWIVLGSGVGWMLGKRRGQAVAGLLLGALLGPIGWLAVFVLPKRGPICPECLAPVDADARKCRHCGSELLFGDGKPY
jgi:hypothetical protein